MKIQWFPGHMNKALKVLEEQLEVVDVVIYVLDARAPNSCLNPEFRKRISKKSVIYVLNKKVFTEAVDKTVKSFITAIAVLFVLMIMTYVLTFIVPGGEIPFWKWASFTGFPKASLPGWDMIPASSPTLHASATRVPPSGTSMPCSTTPWRASPI